MIQCEQYVQSTDVVQKMTADYFVLLGTFTLGDCKYFVERFIHHLIQEYCIKYMNKNGYMFLWTNCE